MRSNETLGMVEYELSELIKLIQESGEQNIPKPSTGKVLDKECHIVSQIRVPYGMRDLFKKMIQNGGLDS